MDKLAKRKTGTSALTKSTAEPLAFYLRGLEEIYRQETTEEELALYLESLSRFPLEEVKAAGEFLMVHPANDWYGLPKLPDFIRTIWAQREERAAEWERGRSEREARELAVLKRRRNQHPEEFIGLEAVAELVQKLGEKVGKP